MVETSCKKIKTHNFPSKIGDFQHLPRFCSIREALCGCRFLYFFSLCNVRNEVVFLLLEHSNSRRVKQKKHVKKAEILAFKTLLEDTKME